MNTLTKNNRIFLIAAVAVSLCLVLYGLYSNSHNGSDSNGLGSVVTDTKSAANSAANSSNDGQTKVDQKNVELLVNNTTANMEAGVDPEQVGNQFKTTADQINATEADINIAIDKLTDKVNTDYSRFNKYLNKFKSLLTWFANLFRSKGRKTTVIA